MKMMILTDTSGNIVASARLDPRLFEGDDPPKQIGIAPEPGQIVHELDVPDKLAELPVAELHQRYRVKARAAAAELVELG